ncbi:MAG: FGGY family carbohydrate kinase, partial [Suipraeoptans sp.]
MADNYIIGMDCGTTNIKAIILGDDGNVVANASRPNKFITLEINAHEQSAFKWWENTVSIFKEITDKAGNDVTSKIRGI